MLEKFEKLANEYIEFIRKYIVGFILAFAILGAFINLPLQFVSLVFSLGFIVFLGKNKIKSFRGK